MFLTFNLSACAKRFALSGAKVILCARNFSELNRVKEEISNAGVCNVMKSNIYFDVTPLTGLICLGQL